MGLLCCAAKCCGCIALSQLCALLLPLAILAGLGLLFFLYAIPWGENQIRHALGLTSDVDIGNLNASYIAANNCSGCVFGSNTQWPTNTTGTKHFLDSMAGSTTSAITATSLAGATVIGTGSMLWASMVPTAAATLSFSAGFYEMTHIVEQAQFVGMISQLRIEGAPTFLLQFSKEMSWTNFNVIKGSSGNSSSSGRHSHEDGRRLAADVVTAAGETGPARYAALIGVDADNLFFYTLLTFVAVLAALHVVYLVFILVVKSICKDETIGGMARKWYRKVIWASVLALLLAQYIFSMAGCYHISNEFSKHPAKGHASRLTLGIVALVAIVLLTLGLGVIVIGKNRDELRDVGTYEHNQRAFSSKYSPYYDQYNFDNRFFFVPRIFLAVGSGAIVGIVRDAMTQLICILAMMMLYMLLLLLRQPNLLPFLYYMGIMSVFLKAVLICLMLIVAKDDFFPQSVRDNVAYGIIGLNIFIFALLFIRQAYMIVRTILIACRHKKNGKDDAYLDETDTNFEFDTASTPVPPFEQVGSTSLGRDGDCFGKQPSHQQQEQVQGRHRQFRTQSSTVSGYSTQSSRSVHLDNVPMLEPASEPVPVFSRSQSNIRSLQSHNQHYAVDETPELCEVTNTTVELAAAPASEVPTYDVLAAYLGTTSLPTEATFSASLNSAGGQSLRNHRASSKGLNSSQNLGSSGYSTSSRGLSSPQNLASSRGMALSRFPTSSRGTAVMSKSVFASRSSSAPLDAYAENFSRSGASTSSSRKPRTVKLYQNVDIDDVDIDDEPAQTFALSSTSQSFDPTASEISAASSVAMMQSYVNFSDSTLSTNKQNAIKQSDNTFSAAMVAASSDESACIGSSPQAKTSIFSNDSKSSFGSDNNSWIEHSSKVAISIDDRESEALEGQSYELGPFGVTKSAFPRYSADSYGFQSTANFTTSRVNFNARGESSSDDGSLKR